MFEQNSKDGYKLKGLNLSIVRQVEPSGANSLPWRFNLNYLKQLGCYSHFGGAWIFRSFPYEGSVLTTSPLHMWLETE